MNGDVGRVHSVETLGAVDGPGLRTVLFLAGCPLRCLYCHNPDTHDFAGGDAMTAEQVLARVMRYRPYYGKTGGVTFSGGEPLCQPAFVATLARHMREAGIHTAVDTSGGVWNEAVRDAVDAVDLVILDVKHTDPARFRALTGVPMDNLHAILAYCKEIQKPLWVRQVILPGWTDTVEEIHTLRRLVRGANVERMELLPYHTLGVHKWEALGLPYPLVGVTPPSQATMDALNAVLYEEKSG